MGSLHEVLQKFVLEEWTKPPMEEITTFVTVPATDVVIRLRRRGVETQKFCRDRVAAPCSHPQLCLLCVPRDTNGDSCRVG